MKECKLTLKEIGTKGAIVSEDAKAHLAECQSCACVYRETVGIEGFLLSAKEVEAPENLKACILKGAENKEREKSIFPLFQTALRVTGLIILMVVGFWLGLQTAKEGNNNMLNDFDVIKSMAYRISIEPIDPESLIEIYFEVVEEVKNEK